MRSRRRIALLLASAGALGVGLIAFPGSAAAVPPVVPTCTIPATPGSDSCATVRTTAVAPPFGGVLEPARLGVRVRSVFRDQNQETTSVKLQLDEQIALNLAGIPTCPPSEVAGRNVSQAWEQCGPGADGSPATEGNAYLSTALGNNVSGLGSTIPNNGGAMACTMIFKGADNAHLTIYARAPTLQCDNPATHTGGTTTVAFNGALTTQPPASIFHHTLTVPNTQVTNPPLDDFYATLARASVVRARCATRNPSAHRMVATWDYFDNTPPDPNDNFTAGHPCPH